ncbi:MAG: nuclease A inhibitor family protein [Oculatellaceae cyanobacterium Prado106]|jgi:hypothetical protein|nr:nuclease A inhibitor family protein [Oculatellaceae cyanobacterium Prado106]
MKVMNETLRQRLQEAIENLEPLFGREHAVTPYFWETAEKGTFTLASLLLENQVEDYPSLTPISYDAYLQRVQSRELFNDPKVGEWRELAQILATYLDELQIYLVYYFDECFYVYLGKTEEVWFGLCEPYPDLKPFQTFSDNATSEGSLNRVSPGTSSPRPQLVEVLENHDFSLTRGLGETYESYIWETAETQSSLLETILTSARFLTTVEFTSFARLMEMVLVDSSEIPDMNQLVQCLKEETSNQKAYVIGSYSNTTFQIYVLGNAQDNDWAGVRLEVHTVS